MKKKNKDDYKITFAKFFGHLHTVNKHRFKVFLLCTRAGIPFRGLVHDLSKYSFTEFFEGVKYFSRDFSPIIACKKVNGYSLAWLHHKGRNKHHFEYWYDYATIEPTPVMPYKYFVEMVCDTLGAGMAYQGKKWTKDYQLDYWMRNRDKAKINPKIDFLLTKIYMDVSEKGIKDVIKRDNLKRLYDEYIR